MQTDGTQSALDQHECQTRTCYERANTRNTVSLRSTQQGKRQARTPCEHINGTQSALGKHSKEMSSYVRATNAQTHGAQLALIQLSEENVKLRTGYECTNTGSSVSLDPTQRGKRQAEHVQ